MTLAERQLSFIQGAITAYGENNQDLIPICIIQNILDQERYYWDGARINGYWAIYDRVNLDEVIWIDCKKELIDCIVRALNGAE